MDYAMLAGVVTLLGWCLVHFLWEAAAIGVLYAAVRPVLPRGNARYVVAMLALLLMAAMPVVTGWHEWRAFARTLDLGDFAVVASAAPAVAVSSRVVQGGWLVALQAALPWLVLAWSLGVCVLGLRVVRQWRGLRAMLRAARALPEWQARARAMAEQLGLRRVIPVLASVQVATPTLVGWMRPAVILPLAVLARMPPAQIDMVLAHELAHLRRFDHVANLFQVVLETLFYYHPVVHWVSRDARNERELCCDAMALRVTGGARRDFVAALAELEGMRGDHAELALAASGGVLVERAWFIAGTAPARPQRRVRGSALLAVLVGAMIALVVWNGTRQALWQQQVAGIVDANRAATALDLAQPPRVLQLVVANVASSRLPATAVATLPAAVDRHDELTSVPVAINAAPAPALNVPDVTPRSVALPAMALPTQPVLASAAAVDLPRPIRVVQPAYPLVGLRAGTQARVVVAFTLDANGRPQAMEIVGAGSGPFDAAALQALAAWRFAPPAVAGQRYRQAFTFALGAANAGNPAARHACETQTGTHICRPLDGAPVLPGTTQALR